MSNLWKALRDVSRDVDPTIGFESPGHGSGGDGVEAETSPAVSDQASASDARPSDHDFSEPGDATHGLSNPGRPRPSIRPGAPHRAARSSEPAPTPVSQGDEPRPRLAPLQSPLRRRLPNSGLHLDPAGGLNKVVRPPQFNGTAPGNDGVTPAAGTAWNAESRPSSPVTSYSPTAGNGRMASQSPAPRPSQSRQSPESPRSPRSPAPLSSLRPESPQSQEHGVPTHPLSPSGSGDRPSPSSPTTGYRSVGGPRPTPTEAAATGLRSDSVAVNGGDVSERVVTGHYGAPAGPKGHVAPGTPTAGAAGRPNGSARTDALAPPLSPSLEVPELRRSFVPSPPDAARDGAARGQTSRWQPGDDDVLPTDGHKGARRPRLRERLPW